MATRREHRRSGIWDSHAPLDQDYYNYYHYDPYSFAPSHGQSSHYSTPRTFSNSSSSNSNSNNGNGNTISQVEARLRAQALASPSPDDGELPDIIIFKNLNETWSFEYPAFSIDDGKLHISDIRRLAGETLGINDTSRIKLMYKGRLLNDDDASAKSQGLKQFSEVVAVVVSGYTEGVYGGGGGHYASNMVNGWREAQLIPVSDSEEEDEHEDEQKEEEEEDERYYYKPPVQRGRSPPKPPRRERRKSVRRERKPERKPRDPSPVSPDRRPRPRPKQPAREPLREPTREPVSPSEPVSPRPRASPKYQYPTPPFPSPSPASFDPLPNICREPRPYATAHPSPSVSSTVSASTYTSDSASVSGSTTTSTTASTPPTPQPTFKPKANETYSVPNRPPTPCPEFLSSYSPSQMLDIFEKHVNDKLIPLCAQFMLHPPADPKARLKEQRRLNEAMERVLARADEITVGKLRALRDRRKAVVQMIQRFQGRIDAMVENDE